MTVALTGIASVFFLYSVKTDGVLHLKKNAYGDVKILREKGTLIAHIHSDEFLGAIYG